MKKISLSAVVLSATLVGFGAIRAVTPDPYGGNPNAWQLKRHAEKMNVVTNGGAKVVFLGDSITHNWEGPGKTVWAKYFASGEMKALNLGTSADRTEHVLWRITEGGELSGYEAKCIVLMIGTNNSGHFPFEQETTIDTVLGVKAILDAIAVRQPKARVILLPIFPRGFDPTNGCRTRNNRVNRELVKFADGKRVIWCDFTDKFLDRAGRLSPEICPDTLHPATIGYEIWASAVVPLIRACLAAAPDTYLPSVYAAHADFFQQGVRTATLPTRADRYWPKRFLEKRNEIVDGTGAYDIVMVGDSITHRWEREGGEGRALFAELKKKYAILNLGYGADKTENVLWRLENGELEGYTAKLFTVMIGTNNGGKDVEGTVEGITKILTKIRTRHPESKIILMPIFPRADTKDAQRLNGYAEINRRIRPLADGTAIRWLDFNAKFFNAEGKLTREVMNDLLHPNEKGYKIWLDAIEPVFREYVTPLAVH